MFKVLIRGRNCKRYIRRCIKSLRQQRCEWEALILLDAPSDGTYDDVFWAADNFENRNRIKIVVNTKRRGVAWAMYHGILELEAKDEDIIVILDADDWLARDALETVARAYENPNTYLTYGSYIKVSVNRRTKISQPYPGGVSVRKYPWRASHLKTFKYHLFKYLDKECFMHKGKWLNAASDLALMLPLIEVAGLSHCKHISKVIYYWNDNTPYKTHRNNQKRCERIVRSKPKLKELSCSRSSRE